MYFFFILSNKSLSDELGEYLSLLLDFRNPVFSSLAITIILILIFFIAVRNTILPQHRKILTEKNMLESRSIRLMALFADLDPDPVIRINTAGEIIFTNPSAQNSGLGELVGNPITGILSALNIVPDEFINGNREAGFELYNSGKYYSVQVKGINYLKIAQLYLHDITEQKLKEEALESSKKELKEFSRYLQKKIEDERKRISRELHDDVGQKLVLLKLNLQNDIAELTGIEGAEIFNKNSRLIEDISKDIKSISFSLRPSSLEEIGLYHSLLRLMETVQVQSCIKGSLDFINIKERFDIELETTIFRIVQEAISNIVKYSGAKEYNVQLIKRRDKLRLIISDEGAGFNPGDMRNNNGMGIRNMKDRAEIHNGAFRISSSKEEGTVITISFPLKGE